MLILNSPDSETTGSLPNGRFLIFARGLMMSRNHHIVVPQLGASHFGNRQLYLDAKYLYGKPFREFIDFQRFSKLCDWNQNRYYKSLLTLLSIYTHYIIGMLP